MNLSLFKEISFKANDKKSKCKKMQPDFSHKLCSDSLPAQDLL